MIEGKQNPAYESSGSKKVYNNCVVSEANKKKYSQYLASGEEIVAVFGIGDRYFWISAIFCFPLAVILIGLPHLLYVFHLRHARTYILTNRRVIIKDGIFSTKLTSAPYDKITHLTVREDFIPKSTYGIGDIVIHTAGPTPVEIDMTKISKPLKVKNLIEELMIRERSIQFQPGLENATAGIVKKFG